MISPQNHGVSKISPAWFQRYPALLEEIQQALQNYPWLHLHIQNGIASVQGSMPVAGDRFNIEIEFLSDYPSSLPVVKEVGGRIPTIPDRHINPADSSACVCIPDEWCLQRPDKSFSTFLKGPVYNFFLSQKYFETHGTWPFGERRHGNEGLLDFYKEQFSTEEAYVIKDYLQCLSQKTIKGHWDCPCGSKKRIRDCHKEALYILKNKIPPHVAKQTFLRLFPKQDKSLKRKKS